MLGYKVAVPLIPLKIEQWFDKGGIPWHESMFFKIVESGEVKKITVTYVTDESEQASTQLCFLTSDLLKQVKAQFPIDSKATIQSDNAGCYYTSALSLSLLFSNIDAQVKR